MDKKDIIAYYSREDIIKEILEAAKSREIAGAFSDGHYDKRPNVVQYAQDIRNMVKKGITSFHLSVERWKSPMVLGKADYDSLRSGWDLIIDMDSRIGVGGSRICAEIICRFLEKYNINNYGIKFSGSRGFHIILPWEMFPNEVNYKELCKMYPKAPRALINFIRKSVSEQLMTAFVNEKGAKNLIEALEEPPDKLDPFYFVDVERGWSSRHMFRAPYSLNEKTWLVSLPLSRKQLKSFDTFMCQPDKVFVKEKFIKFEKNEAEAILLDALDWANQQEKEEMRPRHIKKIIWEKKIPEEMFPPCIKKILCGMKDGRKRSLFTLVNFLRLMNWTKEEIEEIVFKWNENNEKKLPSSIIINHLRYANRNPLNPPNCLSEQFILGVGICNPDDICKSKTDHITIKNPVSYPFRKLRETGKLNDSKYKSKSNYFCGICEKGFKNQMGLNMHKGKTHSGVE